MEKTLSSKKIYDGNVIKLRVDEIENDEGKKGSREIISHNGGAAVLAVKDGKILLERQFRYAYGEELWEVPAGKRDKNEDFAVTARRELEEETGYVPTSLKEIFTMYPSPGYTDEIIKIFYADEFVSGKTHLDETEELTAEWVDEKHAYKLINDGKVKDAKTLIALLWNKAKENERA
ncbi:MAG: NUDIX hydrolase [Clostridia bacterium]|nr:NUDIX hydrolase [Clostridia bacterium]